MREPGDAFKQNPHKKVKLDLVHEGCGPIYGHVAEPGRAGSQNDFARAHYEQHMKVSGTLQVEDGPVLEISGHGLRDHSWGTRYWQSTPSYRWITGNFGDDLAADGRDGVGASQSAGRKGGLNAGQANGR